MYHVMHLQYTQNKNKRIKIAATFNSKYIETVVAKRRKGNTKLCTRILNAWTRIESPFIFLLFPFRFVQQLKFTYLNKSNFVYISERNNKAHTTWICAIHIVFINSMSIDEMIYFQIKLFFLWRFSFENSIIGWANFLDFWLKKS